MTEAWFSAFLHAQIQHLSYSHSDHCPILLSTEMANKNIRKALFHFEAWWLLESSFEKMVKDAWDSTQRPLLANLKELKQEISQWAHVKQGRQGVKQQLHRQLDRLLDKDRTDDNLAEIINRKIHLNQEIDKDEIYWEQSSCKLAKSGR